MSWKYNRIKSAKCSKWVRGNCWVTKYDDQPLCIVGVLHKKVDDYYETNPRIARKWVEKSAKAKGMKLAEYARLRLL